MTSNTNNKSDQNDQLYGVLLYKNKDIIATQEKLGINSNVNQAIMHQSKIVYSYN
jgi:hypothetical protein